MDIFDGVIFARKRSDDSDWKPHVISKGLRKGTAVEKNVKTGALREVRQTERTDDAGATRPEPGLSIGGRPVPGGTSGSSDGRSGEVQGDRIITARAAHTREADTSLVPQSLRGALSEHQVRGAALMIGAMDAHGGGLLADGTGVGKTRTELAVAQTYAMRGKKVLIVTKSEVIRPDWTKEKLSGSFLDDSAAMGVNILLNKGDRPINHGEVHITTYDRLGDIKGKVDRDTVLILDESHAAKNWGSSRSKHVYEMSKAAQAVLYATATPADKPLHIAHLFRARVFGNRSWESTYQELGMRQKEVRVPGGKTIKKWEIDPRVGAGEVYRRMSGLFDRMTAEGLMVKRELNFSGVDVGFKRIQLPPEAHQAMEQIERNMSGSGANPGLERAMTLMHQRRQQEPYKIPEVVSLAGSELSEGRQVIIFASRVNESGVGDREDGSGVFSEGTAGLLRKALEDSGVPPNEIADLHGGVSPKQRKAAMDSFQSGKARVIIATVESGGTGVNLDDTSGNNPRTIIMMTPPFSAVENVQAAGRVWRLKTKSFPRIRYVFGDTDVDDWNASLISGKMKALGATVAGQVNYLDIANLDVSPEEEAERMGAGSAAESTPYEWPSLVARRQIYPERPASPPPAPAPVVSPGTDRPVEPPTPYMSEQRRRIIHEALRKLANLDMDRARERNDMGFNQMDSSFGADLARRDSLTDRQAHAAARMLAKYRRQIGDESHSIITTQEVGEPSRRLPVMPAVSQSITTREVNTSRGRRHVHSFSPSSAFWEARRAGGIPQNVSVSKNARTGAWEGAIWGETPEEVTKTHQELRGRNLI